MNRSLLHNAIPRTLLLIALSSRLFAQSAAPEKYPMQPALVEPGPKELASSRVSMVSAAHPLATQAGLEMLRRGGNAMDATIAATMVTAVLDVGLSTFGGGGELTYYDAKAKRSIAINCDPRNVREDVMPYHSATDNTTGRAIPVPGSIAGFYYAIQKYGALPWKQVIEPAIFYAENGFPIYGPAYIIMADRYHALTLRPSVRQMFAPNGFLPPVGSIFKQPELAETLKKVQDQGADYFYKGPFAEQMVKAIQDLHGKATLEDFASYRALDLEPIRGTYWDYQIVGPPLPASGTVAIIEGLNILENVDLKRMGHYSESADSLQWLIETVRVMFNDAYRYIGVPELDRHIAQALLSKEYARAQYKLISHKIEETKRQAKEKPVQVAETAFKEVREDEGHTNHVSVVDKDGNVCSFTHTIYGPIYSAHGLFVGGIVLGSGRGRVPPGERLIASIAPLIVFKGDKPFFASGSSGGTPNTFYTILNVLAWDKNLKEAQDAPRLPNFYSAPTLQDLDDHKVVLEHRIDDKVAEELRARAYKIEWVGPYSQGGPVSRWLGGAQMVGVDPNSGIRYGATDPRGVGQAAGQ